MAPTPWRPEPEVHEAGLRHLQEDMAARGLSISALAQLAGISRGMLGYILAGVRFGSTASHAAISNTMGRCPGYYFPRSALELARAEAYAADDEPVGCES